MGDMPTPVGTGIHGPYWDPPDDTATLGYGTGVYMGAELCYCSKMVGGP